MKSGRLGLVLTLADWICAYKRVAAFPGPRRQARARKVSRPIIFEVIRILLLIVANGVFALAEIAVVSARKKPACNS